MQKVDISSQVTMLTRPCAIDLAMNMQPDQSDMLRQMVANLKRKPCTSSSNLRACPEARKKPRPC